ASRRVGPRFLVMQLATPNLWDDFCQYTAALNAQWARGLGHRYVLTAGEYLERGDLWRGGNVRAVLEVLRQAPE
ncbi:cspG, partial [Symbiodinium sp. KB8]